MRGLPPNINSYQSIVQHLTLHHGKVLTQHVAFPALEKELTDQQVKISKRFLNKTGIYFNNQT